MRNPEKIYGVSMGQLSVARHYGGCTFNGSNYIYVKKDDCLIREDIFEKEKTQTPDTQEKE